MIDAPGRVVYDAGTIERRVRELAAEIGSAYEANGRLLLLGVLKGSFVFLADLVRALEIPVQVDFLVVSSYGDAVVSSGEVRFEYLARAPLEGRDVLLVEDIVDSGRTLDEVVPALLERGARSVEICALLHKRRAECRHEPRFVGFAAPDAFLVGYGLDHAEDFRQLPYVASL